MCSNQQQKSLGEKAQTTTTAITSEAWGFCPTLGGLKRLNYRDGAWVSQREQREGQIQKYSEKKRKKGKKKTTSLLIDLHPLKDELIVSAEL